MSGTTTLCTIADDYTTTASCTFDLVAFADEEIEVSIDSDSWAYEGTLTVTFNDGSTAVETWSADTTFSYAHVGDELVGQVGEYTITISDPGWGDGGHDVEVYFDGDSVCTLASVYGAPTDASTFSVFGPSDAVLQVDIDSDSYPGEGQLDVTFHDGSTATETSSSDTSFSYTKHPEPPAAGEVALSNGH